MYKAIRNPFIYLSLTLLLLVVACQRQTPFNYDEHRPQRTLKEYFDKKYLLYKLPADYYAHDSLQQTFSANKTQLNYKGVDVTFSPLGYADSLRLQYTHVYSKDCVYHKNDSTWKFAEVMFPNTCITKDQAYAVVKLHSTNAKAQTLNLRLFYQNTSYWYATHIGAGKETLDNYYGKSDVASITLAPNADTTIRIAYTIGMNPKGEFWDADKAPARPGNYEFLLVVDESSAGLMDKNIDIEHLNPFAEVVNKQLSNYAYVGPKHFKFVFLDEYFDGTNDLHPNHVYIAKDGKEKRLCDTCTGYYRAAIDENWNSDTYFKGYLSKRYFVKGKYGILKENTIIDSNGITFKMPASKRGEYNKTWGEVLFGPSIKYGHITVRAKFAPMFNKAGTPNGIIHNLWLYERDPSEVDSTNPYHHLQNGSGKQPYEIDFEMWSSMEGVNGQWDDKAFINYSIVDYMRDTSVLLKPGEHKQMGRYKAERLNNRQAGIPGYELDKDFFNNFHTYEMYWYPDRVVFKLDGEEVGLITKDMADIPDTHMFLWIGSPMYQDGTYYSQSNIPFLKFDKYSVIDYIRIE